MKMRHWTVGLALVASVSGLGCKKSDKNSAASAAADDPEATNPLAAAFPEQLALSVFPTESSTSLGLEEVSDPNLTKNNEQMVDENKKILKGEAEDCLDRDLFKPFKDLDPVTCYEFDSDMNPSKFSDRPGKSWGTTDGTNGKGEACLVSFTRAEARSAIAVVQKALAIVSGMICQAKVKDPEVKMPEAGDKELVLTDAMSDAAGTDMPVSEAKIEVSESTALDGTTYPTYTSTVKMKDRDGNDMEVYLTNQKQADGETGKLSFKRPATAGVSDLKNDQNNTANKNEYLSITYDISGTGDDTNAKLEIRRAAIVNTIKGFNSDGLVNFEGVPEDAENSSIHRINFIGFDINPLSGEGNFSYWMNPGGRYDESARGFVYNVTSKDGKMSGCGYSGATSNISIRKHFTDVAANKTSKLEPTGWWHPRENQNISADKDPRFDANNGTKITKQCFTQNESKEYKVDTDDDFGYELVTTKASGMKLPAGPARDLPPPPPDVVK